MGTVIGFRFHNGFLPAVAAILLAVLFGFAFSWIFAFIGLSTGQPETAQLAGFAIIFPLVFASSAFVPTAAMPGWLQAFANHQPVTQTANAIRAQPGRRGQRPVDPLAAVAGRDPRGVRATRRGSLPQRLSGVAKRSRGPSTRPAAQLRSAPWTRPTT